MSCIRPSVHIILLNYNNYEDTIECVNSLQKISYPNYKIVVVDNNSSNDSELVLRNEFQFYENLKLIQAGENLGFSGGNNVGIQWALDNHADYVCLLNNDTIVECNFLEPLVSEMEVNKEIGITSGKILYFDNPNKIWAAGGKIDPYRCIGVNLGLNCETNQSFNDKCEVDFLTGCLQLISVDVFKRIGLYTDEYFLYMEDVDFCVRVSSAGYKLLYIPESKIYHKVSASSGGENSPIVVYYLNRNRLLFNSRYQKNSFRSLIFKGIFFAKVIINPLRGRGCSKYLLLAIKDYIEGNFGYRKLN